MPVSDHPESTDVATESEFHDALRALVADAESNGVDVRGSWPVSDDEAAGVWDVEITAVDSR
jgi:hypothetical protein